MKTLADRINWILANRPEFKSVRALTIASQLSPATLSNRLRDEKDGKPANPDTATFKKVAATARVSFRWLSTGAGDPNDPTDIPEPLPPKADEPPQVGPIAWRNPPQAKSQALERFPEMWHSARYGPASCLAAAWLVDHHEYTRKRAVRDVQKAELAFDAGLAAEDEAVVLSIVTHVLTHRDVKSSDQFPSGSEPVTPEQVAQPALKAAPGRSAKPRREPPADNDRPRVALLRRP